VAFGSTLPEFPVPAHKTDGASRLEQGGVGRSGGAGRPACGLRLLSHGDPVDEETGQGRFGPVSRTGRDCLTNYLTETVCCGVERGADRLGMRER